MANPLREALATKYSGSSPGVTESPGGSSNSLRESLTKKYGPKAELNPVTIAGSGRNVYNSGPSVTPADNRTNREKYTTKYAEPVANSRVGKERATVAEAIKKKNIEENGSIASPEYFATSVDVRSPSGKFLKTFEAEGPGEAKRLATEYAIENDGYIQVTPPGGVFGKVYTRVKEAFQGALDNYQEKAGGFLTDLGGQMPNPDGGPNRVDDPNAGPLRRTTSGIELGVAGVEVLLSPLSAAFMGAEELPIAGKPVQGINYIFGKLGEGGGWAADKAVDALPVTDATKDEIRPAAEELTSLLAQLAGGKATVVGYKKSAALREKIKVSMTKDIIETNQLPRNVYISPEAVRSIFIDSSKLTEAEASMIKDLGLDGKGYRQAIKDGISIEIPAERIITIVDKPWFAQVKSIFNIEPTSERVVNTQGKTVQRTPQKEVLRLDEGKSPNSTPVPIQPVKNAPETLITESITPNLLERVNSLTPEESSAFGKRVFESINETLGLKVEGEKANLPDNIKVVESPSGDGRPAQIKNGQIEIFLPDLLSDIQSMANGGTIKAHEGEYSTVYKKLEDESMEELATRYVRDIVMHEASHQKTMTMADQTTIRNLSSKINEAKLAQDSKAVTTARQDLEKFMASMEDKANAYMKENKVALEQEFFGGAKRESQTSLQRKINKKVSNSDSGKSLKRSEKQVLKNKLKVEARGSRFGKKAGTKEERSRSKKEAKNKKDILEESNKRSTELKTLKQRILDRDRSNKKVDEQRSMRETAVEKINKKSATIAERKKAAIDYAQILPFRERGKFLKAINNLSSQKQFLDVLERISKASRASERKVLIQKIQKELKGAIVKKKSGLPDVKFEIEAQRTLNEMIRLQKTMSYQEAQMAIVNKISSWQTENPDGAIPVDLLRDIEVLKTVGIKDQTVSELSYTLSAIESLKETGRTKKEIEIFNRETDIQQMKDKISDVITGGLPLPSDKLSVKNRQKENTTTKNIKEFLTTQQYGFEEILDVFSLRDKNSLPYESFLSRNIGDKVNDSFNNQNRGEMKVIEGVSNSLKEIYGLDKNTEVMLTLGNLKEVSNLGDFRHADGVVRTLELSRGEAIQYHMWMQDETLLETFTDTLNWTPEIMKAVSDSLTANDKKMADFLIDEFYPKYYESINEVYSKEYGVDLPFNSNYSPVHRAVDAVIPENVLLAQESAKYATARNGSLKERQNSRIDLVATDAFENVMRHVAKMEHYKAWSNTMFELRRVFGDKQIRQAITDIHGPGYMKVMDNFLNDFARDGVAREKIIKAVDTLRMNTTKALLGLNLKVGIKQLTGVLNYGIELPAKDLFGGIGDFWLDPIGKSRFLYEKSATLQERFGEGYERDVKFAIQKGYDKKLAKANNLSEVLFIPIRNADKFTVYQGAWAVYKSEHTRAKTAGKSDAEAERLGIRAAENITNRIQESSRLDTLSAIQRGGSLAKLFTMLAGQPNKYLRVMNNAGRNYKAGRQSGSVAARRVLWTWIVVPLVYNIVADQLIDEEYRDSPGGLVTRTLLGPLSYPLIIGQLWQQIYGWTQGEQFTYQASPVESFSNDIKKGIENFLADDMVDAVTYAIDTMGKFVGLPTTIITRPVRNANKEKDSDVETVSF